MSSALPGVEATRARIAAGATSAEANLRECLARIEALNPKLQAFHSVAAESSLKRARELDAFLKSGAQPGALHGVPVALKSNLCASGHETNCGSRLLAGWQAPYTARAVERLLDAGAILVGMTHMDEFGFGSSGENSGYATARNPHDPERTAGGSSSGSAVAVASGMVPLALGSDTGGSVRQPAALCGIAGFKPSYGRIPRHGLVAFGSSLDCISPFARSVGDLECAMEVLSGHDASDATSIEEPPLVRIESSADLSGWRIGVPRECFEAGLEAGLRTALDGALRRFESLGARCVEVSLPHLRHAIATYYIIACAEASSNLARFDGVRYGVRHTAGSSLAAMMSATRERGFGAEVKRRVLLGTFVLSAGYHEAWYQRAQRVRARIAQDFEQAFEQCEVLVTPTTPSTAFRLGEKSSDPLAMYLSDVLTVPANLAGIPALSIDCGRTQGLPVGMQILGPARADARVLRAGRVFERKNA
ncbi:MAG: Asp-tRNA(Asn)/Glu-tRNA(Gln) amidotransferase subunit GatA [Planctomycetia bacterium]